MKRWRITNRVVYEYGHKQKLLTQYNERTNCRASINNNNNCIIKSYLIRCVNNNNNNNT